MKYDILEKKEVNLYVKFCLWIFLLPKKIKKGKKAQRLEFRVPFVQISTNLYIFIKFLVLFPFMLEDIRNLNCFMNYKYSAFKICNFLNA